MQVELSSIVQRYRELLAEKTHEALCYHLAIKKLEEENRQLKQQLEEFKGDIDARNQATDTPPPPENVRD